MEHFLSQVQPSKYKFLNGEDQCQLGGRLSCRKSIALLLHQTISELALLFCTVCSYWCNSRTVYPPTKLYPTHQTIPHPNDFDASVLHIHCPQKVNNLQKCSPYCLLFCPKSFNFTKSCHFIILKSFKKLSFYYFICDNISDLDVVCHFQCYHRSKS